MQIRRLLAFACLGLLLAGVPGLDARARKNTRKASASYSSNAGKAKASGRHGRRGGKSRVARRSGPPRQAAPTQERYAEIQKALADKGYYSGPQDGIWTADCTDALRRFQSDNNLTADGKLGALSLIALGLGPKRGPDTDIDVASRPSSEPAIEP